MITQDDYFGPVKHIDTPDEEETYNASVLLARVNALLAFTGFKTTVASGWRPPQYNEELRKKFLAGEPGGANTAVRSKHMTGEAIDLVDNKDQQIAKYLLANPQVLQDHGLWMEHPSATKGKFTNWCHLQSRSPKSGNRIFFP